MPRLLRLHFETVSVMLLRSPDGSRRTSARIPQSRQATGQRKSAKSILLHSGRTGRTRTTVRTEKRIDGQRSGTALAFSAVAPWARPGFAAHLIILSHPQRRALWSVPTIVKFCRHCGLQAMHGQSRPLRRQHFDPCKRSIERAPPGATPMG